MAAIGMFGEYACIDRADYNKAIDKVLRNVDGYSSNTSIGVCKSVGG